MTLSEKYLIGCVTVMTAAYLWLIWQYSRQVTADTFEDVPVESGFVYDDPEDELPIPAPEGLNRPTVKGLEDE